MLYNKSTDMLLSEKLK